MQLILAIDSDPRRSGQLASLVRARLHVDLVQATSAGEGLHVLKDRVPDLILTSPLLSPFDDGVLDEYLRDLGAAGAHVQTLRIPLLSAAPPKRALTDRLFKRSRTKPASPAAPDGCDPAVFADEIAVYLSRAVSARESVAHLSEAWSARKAVEQPSPAAGRPVDAVPIVPDYWTRVHEACVEEFTEAIEQADAEAACPRRTDAGPDDEMTSAAADVVASDTVHVDETVSAAAVIDHPAPEADAAPHEPTRADKNSTFEAALAAIRAAWVKPEASTSETKAHTLTRR